MEAGEQQQGATKLSSSDQDEPPLEGVELNQYLTFLLNEEMFAIDILSIREIIEYGVVSVVPMCPPFIRGVLNLRGAVVPVIDLSIRLGLGPSESSKRTCIVIAEIKFPNGYQEMGMVVDAVNEVMDLPPIDIEPPPDFGAKIRNDFIKGMGKLEGKFVMILDLSRVLSAEEVSVLSYWGKASLSSDSKLFR